MNTGFPRRVEAVLFDMDGLLIDSEVVWRGVMIRAGADLGYELTPAVFQQMIGARRSANDTLMQAEFGSAFPLDVFWTRAAELAEAATEAGIALKLGAVDLLIHLEEACVPRALVTSSDRAMVNRHLPRLDVLRHFSVIVTGDEVAHGKPHPEPYLKAADGLGLPPAHCLALEDSHNGVRAAHAAGMMAVMVPDLLAATAEMHEKCCLIARDLHEVRTCLQRQT